MSMIPDEAPAHLSPGHNLPPSPLEALVAMQREAQAPFKDRLEYFVMKADAKQVTDRDTAGDAGDIIRLAGQFMEPIERERISLTKPYRDAADAAKATLDKFLEPLTDAVTRLRERLEEWSKEEDGRIEQQQAEQEAFFAKPAHITVDGEKIAIDYPRGDEGPAYPNPGYVPPTRETPVLPAKRRKIVGDLGAKVSIVDNKVYRVVDVLKVDPLILNSKTVHDAIIQVAKSMAKHMPEMTGIEITTEVGNKIS